MYSLMSEWTLEMANPVLSDSIISIFSLGILCIGCVCLYQELTHTLYIYTTVYLFKYTLNLYPITEISMFRLTSKVKIWVKYMAHQLIIISLLVTTLLWVTGTVLVLMNPTSNVPVISLIVGSITMQVFLL